MRTLLLKFTATALAAGIISGCTSKLETPQQAATDVNIACSSSQVALGKTIDVKVTNTKTGAIISSSKFTVSDPSILEVDSSSSSVKVKGLKKGSATVVVTAKGTQGTCLVNVTSDGDGTLLVSPETATFAKGLTQQYQCFYVNSSGTKSDKTSECEWSSSAANIATVGNTGTLKGLATGVTTGTAKITAKYSSLSATATATISSATLVSIAVTPSNPTVNISATQQMTATATMSDGSQQDVTSTATWSSGTTGVATVSSSGLVTGVAAGTSTITATVGSISGSTTVTVPAVTLVSIAVTPTNPSIVYGTTQQFTAIGTYSDTSTGDVTNSATWVSATPATATINSTGLATSVANGTTNITATVGAVTSNTAVLTVTLQAVPPDPTGFSATAVSTSQINLSWTSGGGTTATYTVAYQTGAMAPANCASGTMISGLSGTSTNVTGLSTAQQYSFRVCALNSNPTPDVSAGVTASATTFQAPPPDPTGLSATVNSTTQITLNWSSGGGSTNDYVIKYAVGATAPANCSSPDFTVAALTKAVSGLTAATQYSFRVCARNSNGTPDVSSGVTVTATTLLVPPPDPTGLTATVNSTTQITLDWASGGGTTNDYVIKYTTGATAPANCTTPDYTVAALTKAVTGLTAATQYSFRLCARNSNATPDVSAGITVTATTTQAPPPDPTGLTATVNSATQITLDWASGGGTTNDYVIKYTTGATAPANCSSPDFTVAALTKAVTGLTAATQYSFRLCARNSNGTPDVSTGVTVTATTLQAPPPDPTGLTATVNSTTQITLDWASGGGSTNDYVIKFTTGATAPANCTTPDYTVAALTKAVTGLTAATQYSFRLCARNSNGTPDVSAGVTVTATTLQAPPPDPTGLSATVNSTTQITLNWSSGGGTTNDYVIKYTTGATAPANCSSPDFTVAALTKAVTGLTAATQYSFRLCARNANGTPDVSAGVTVTATTNVVPPPDPTGLTATVNSTTQITLDWASGGGTTNDYVVKFTTGATAPANCSSPDYTVAAITKAVTGLTAATQYSFRVCARNNNGTPDVSTGVTVTATTLQAPPPNPAGLTATVNSTTQITLDWTSGGGTTNDYVIKFTTGATAPADCSSPDYTVAAITKAVTGLTAATQYSFRVCARNSNGTPDVSTGVTVTATTYVVPPPNPTGLTATVNSTTQITLDWISGGGTTNDYVIKYTTGATAPANCSSPDFTVAAITKAVTGLSAATQYSFRVCARNNNGTPDVSSGVTVTATTLQAPPPDPTGLTATANSGTQITLDWTSGGGSTNDYVIKFTTGGTAPANCSSPDYTVAALTKAVTGLTAATQYSFRVCARNSNGTPDVSSGTTVTATTLAAPPPDPTGLSANVDSTTQITLSWTSGGGSTNDFVIKYATGGTAPANCTSPDAVSAASPKAISGLSANTQYSFRLCARNNNPTPDVSSGVTVTATTLQAAPPNPTGLSATVDTATQITLNWTSGGGSTASYKIAYQSGASAPADCASGTTTTSAGVSKAIAGLNAASQYSFRVCALNTNPTPDVSSGVTVSATTLQAVPPDPTGLSATPNSTTQITLNWTSGGGSTNDYVIKYTTGATAPANCSSPDFTVAALTKAVTGLTAATQYSFRVCARNSNATPDVSSGATVTATTLLAAPPNPTGLSVTRDSTTQVTVSWSSGGGTTNDYAIKFQSGVTAPSDCSSPDFTQAGTSKAVTGLSVGTNYAFRICARNSNPTPDVSSGATITGKTLENPPPNPTGFTATAASDTQINLSWTSGGGSTADYKVVSASGATAPADCSSAGTTTSSTTLSVTGLSASTQYSFRVCSRNSNPTPDVSSGVTASATTSAAAAWSATTMTSANNPGGGDSFYDNIYMGWINGKVVVQYYGTGGQYNVGADNWTANNTTGAPGMGTGQAWVATSTHLLMFGGGLTGGGSGVSYRYNVAGDTWSSMNTTGAPGARTYASAVWTGSKMIILGGINDLSSNTTRIYDGGVYDPVGDSWTAIPAWDTGTANSPNTYNGGTTAIWIGNKVFLYGNISNSSNPAGGTDEYAYCKLYTPPPTDTWADCGTAGTPPSLRARVSLAWTGTEVLLFGGSCLGAAGCSGAAYKSDAFAYNPGTGTWRTLSSTNAPSGRHLAVSVLGGTKWIIWGGTTATNTYTNTGAIFDTVGETWTAMPTTNAPTARAASGAVWNGTSMIIWGGTSTAAVPNGGVFTPP